jgi:ribosomal L13-like protein
MRTHVPKGREAEDLTVGKNWFVVDANGLVLGRVATRIARLLIGKDKPNYTPHLDCGEGFGLTEPRSSRLLTLRPGLCVLELPVAPPHAMIPVVSNQCECLLSRNLVVCLDCHVREAVPLQI